MNCCQAHIKMRQGIKMEDQPVDLRVSSAIERSRPKEGKNLILATLLTSSTSYRGRVLYSSKENIFINKCEDSFTRDAKNSIIDQLEVKGIDRYPKHGPFVRNSIPSTKQCDVKSEPEVTVDKEILPNYRKFYSRYSSLSLSPAVESTTQELDSSHLDCSIIQSNSSTFHASYAHHGHLFRLLQRDENRPKRKLLTDTNNTNKKDKTLRCLLSSSVSQSPHDDSHLKTQPYPVYWKQEREYCPQAVSADNTVLRGLLVSKILPPSGPPSSGSPGSESTSSGSTDSGVFSSDNIPDERRRASRVLSGRHVKTGTGASLTTLRLLRQMILERKNRNDRKL